jgi:hypothetical protein
LHVTKHSVAPPHAMVAVSQALSARHSTLHLNPLGHVIDVLAHWFLVAQEMMHSPLTQLVHGVGTAVGQATGESGG